MSLNPIKTGAIIIFVLGLFILQGTINKNNIKPINKVTLQDTSYDLDTRFYNLTHFGHQRLISSLLWVLTLIESDTVHHKIADGNSWMFTRFNSISKLDPYFYEVYRHGGVYLSIIKDDDLGAEKIFDEGLKFFPEDFWLNYHAGFHYYYELNNINKALASYNRIVDKEEIVKYVPFLPRVIAKLNVARGDDKTAYELLLGSYNSTPDGHPMKIKLAETLYSIKAKIDLECLNEGGSNCSYKDFNGESYRLNGTKYETALPTGTLILKQKKGE